MGWELLCKVIRNEEIKVGFRLPWTRIVPRIGTAGTKFITSGTVKKMFDKVSKSCCLRRSTLYPYKCRELINVCSRLVRGCVDNRQLSRLSFVHRMICVPLFM